jgi:S-adenosylmethionine synthetase
MSDGDIARVIEKLFDMRPYAIEQRLKLRAPIYQETAAYGHMGRKNEMKTKVFNEGKDTEKKVTVELFTWEKLDYVDKIRKAFKIK